MVGAERVEMAYYGEGARDLWDAFYLGDVC
jgi:hypothetical protein